MKIREQSLPMKTQDSPSLAISLCTVNSTVAKTISMMERKIREQSLLMRTKCSILTTLYERIQELKKPEVICQTTYFTLPPPQNSYMLKKLCFLYLCIFVIVYLCIRIQTSFTPNVCNPKLASH